jgi:hypothetical protein
MYPCSGRTNVMLTDLNIYCIKIFYNGTCLTYIACVGFTLITLIIKTETARCAKDPVHLKHLIRGQGLEVAIPRLYWHRMEMLLYLQPATIEK